MIRPYLFQIAILISSLGVKSTLLAQGNSTSKHYLLMDVELQLESLDGLQALYNYDFAKADSNFTSLKNKYHDHPIGYYLIGLMQWWKILPNIENKDFDDNLILYMDSSIIYAQKMYEKDNNDVEANFFLAAAHGLKGRIYSDRGNWRKATVSGKEAMSHIDKNNDIEDLNVEFLFGKALYNYYSVWVPEKYPVLKPVMLLFPKGNAEEGINQLKDVAFNSFYTRVEAQTHLLSIYLDVEALDNVSSDQRQQNNQFCYALLKDLIKEYPNNPYFARIFAKCCFNLGYISEMVESSKNIIDKFKSKIPFYEEQSARYASFFLGYYNHIYTKNNAEALKYFKLSEEVSETLNAFHMGYYHYTLYYTGQEYYKLGKKDQARDYFKKVKKYASRGDSVYKMAKDALKKL